MAKNEHNSTLITSHDRFLRQLQTYILFVWALGAFRIQQLYKQNNPT